MIIDFGDIVASQPMDISDLAPTAVDELRRWRVAALAPLFTEATSLASDPSAHVSDAPASRGS